MKRRYLIDHKILFLFGYLFYFFVPYFVGSSKIFEDLPGMSLYYQYFQLIPKEKLVTYVQVTLSWLPAFYLGHLAYKFIGPPPRSLQLFPVTVTTDMVSYVGVLLLLLLAVFTFQARTMLFSGYGSYEIGVRGKLNTLLMIFDFFLLYQLVSREKVSALLVMGTLFTCLISLSLGGRVYVIETFMVLLLYKTSYAPRKWTIPKIATISFLVFLISSFVGLWRISTSFSFLRASYSMLAEPVFTWFSTSTYLAANDVPMFSVPLNFITSFLNLVPNSIISFKPFIVSTASMVKNYQNPLGADSVWSTFVINFGTVGSFIFIFITGFMLNFLKALSTRHHFWAVYYILVCGMLPFQFFRDGFFIVNKQLFFNFLFFPGLILILLKTIYFFQVNSASKIQKPEPPPSLSVAE